MKRRRIEANNNSNNNGGGSKKKSSPARKELAIAATKYSGPIDQPAYKQACDLHTFVFCINGQLTSSAAGVLATVFDSYAQATTAADWVTVSPAFKEYRILAMKVKFLPWNRYSKATTTVTTPVYVVTDRTDSSPIASLSAAASSATCMQKSLEDVWTKAVRMDSIEESTFVPVGTAQASASRMYIKLYSSGLSNSTTYGDFLTHVVVQFRAL